VEIKDKLKSWDGMASEDLSGEPVTVSGDDRSLEEAETALISLGYKPQEASRAVIAAAKILEESGQVPDSESLIRSALKNMS